MTYPPPDAPAPPAPPPKPDRTWWLAGGITAGFLALATVVVVGVLAVRASGANYTYVDDLCDHADISPLVEHFPVTGTNHSDGRSEGSGVGSIVCEYQLDTQRRSSDLRIIADVTSGQAWARERYTVSVEGSSSADPDVHGPFDTIEEVAGPWQDGWIFVGDVFASADYTVRLVALDSNLFLHVTLIMSGPDAPGTYEADGAMPRAVQQVAENTIDTLAR